MCDYFPNLKMSPATTVGCPTSRRKAGLSFGCINPAGSRSVFLVSGGTGKTSVNALHQARQYGEHAALHHENRCCCSCSRDYSCCGWRREGYLDYHCSTNRHATRTNSEQPPVCSRRRRRFLHTLLPISQ